MPGPTGRICQCTDVDKERQFILRRSGGHRWRKALPPFTETAVRDVMGLAKLRPRQTRGLILVDEGLPLMLGFSLLSGAFHGGAL